VKTNYLPRLCRDLYGWGARAEVVSPMEYELARKLRIDPRDIVVNGPLKEPAFLEAALEDGALVNLDDFHEIELAQKLQRRHPRKRLRVGLRIDFPIPSENESRFGFSLEHGDVDRALRLLRRPSGIQLEALHAHYCFKGKNTKSYSRLAAKMAALYKRLRADGQDLLGEVNLGGGFYSAMPRELARQFPGPMPTFADYGRAIAGHLARELGRRSGPRLVLEPGVSIVADALTFVTTVVGVKERGTRRLACVTGSVYDIKPTKSRVNLPLCVYGSGRLSRSASPCDIVGQTCMEDDVLCRGYRGPLKAGDLVAFENVGAYSIVLKPPFIYPAFPVIAVEGGSYRVLRRKESFEDVFAAYRVS
jgi:diaminopimelate decarboxylase